MSQAEDPNVGQKMILSFLTVCENSGTATWDEFSQTTTQIGPGRFLLFANISCLQKNTFGQYSDYFFYKIFMLFQINATEILKGFLMVYASKGKISFYLSQQTLSMLQDRFTTTHPVVNIFCLRCCMEDWCRPCSFKKSKLCVLFLSGLSVNRSFHPSGPFG